VSLQKFMNVISNPEIKGIVSVLLKALNDPTNQTENALSTLIKTSFYNYIDSPSLALVMPIVERGLKERSTEIKKKAAHVKKELI
jgi:hypothetical protein